MPLTWLGQLKPTMEQQTALQKALLALSREDEAMRKRAEKKPVLARRLAPERGPSYAETHRPVDPAYRKRMEAAPVTRAPLERALEPGVRRPDWQAEAWAKGREIEAEEQTRLDAEADALYGAVQDLSKSDQDYILSQVVSRGRSTLEEALEITPGAPPTGVLEGKPRQEGFISSLEKILSPDISYKAGGVVPEAVEGGVARRTGRTDPLMQTLIDKHYIRLDENGETYSWMLPEPEKKFVEMIVDPQSGEWKKVYADGSIEGTGMFGDITPEIEAPPLSAQVSLARLQFDVEKYGQINVELAVKQLGPPPILGATMRKPGTDKYREVEQSDIDAYYVSLEELSQYLRVAKGGPQTLDDIRALYMNSPEAIRTVQQQLGLEPTGVWSTELEQAVFEIFSRGK